MTSSLSPRSSLRPMDSRTSCVNRLMSVSLIGEVVALPSAPTFCQSSNTTPTLRRFKLPDGCLMYDKVRSTSKLRVLRDELELGPVLVAPLWPLPGDPGVGAPAVPGGWLLRAPGMPSAPSLFLRVSLLVCSLRTAVFCGS